MATLSFLVGIIGNIISVFLFLSPTATFSRIVKEESTQEFKILPYICTLLVCTLWTYYGLTKPGELLLITINGFGIIVEAIYVILFLIYAPPRMKVKTATLVGILNFGFVLIVVLVTRFLFEGETRINVIGTLVAGFSIIMYASPLSIMTKVVRTKSVEFMPFFLSFFVFLNCGAWLFYAVLESDYFIGVSNGIGLVLGTMQLVLYALYKNGKPSTNIVEDMEDGSQHDQPLISS